MSHSSVGKALGSVWWENASRLDKVRGNGRDGRSMFVSLLTAMVAVGGRPKKDEVSD